MSSTPLTVHQAPLSRVGAKLLAPDNADALRLMGVAAQMCGDQATAIRCFRRVIGVWPGDSGLYSGLGMALFETGETDEALGCLRRACELAPGAAATWFNLGEALRQNARTITQQWDFYQLMEYSSGLLVNDQKHQFKLYGAYALTKEWALGAHLFIASGHPKTCLGAFGADQSDPLSYGTDSYHFCGDVPTPRGTTASRRGPTSSTSTSTIGPSGRTASLT